ncbi:MAG: hypothetical protein NTU41_12335 [Chloroflexi bacterium]|nr:hypothetical protein [Chloroflexota bacterium]
MQVPQVVPLQLAEEKEIRVQELQNYSGSLMRELRSRESLEVFSKYAIVRMITEASKLYLGSEGGWYTVARKTFGEQLANELDREVWLRRARTQIVARLRNAFNIQGDDVASLLKLLQIEPLFATNVVTYELTSEHAGTVTVHRCRALEYFERHGENVLQKNACGMHVSGLQEIATELNPGMSIRATVLPPRKITMGYPGRNQPPVACRWEVSLKG